ncbi:MarR family winged helix-turn-helix transcriptional regulator [Dyadobacter sp.]|uniref:MarR family winged helix-turn-helix transcriptional regulator n=1 Tax=Dyadobacter sp. TaxID=1914288 RepID=UPI003F7007E6
MDQEELRRIRKLSQQYAFTSIQLHEAVARKAGLPGTDHKYLGFLLEKGQMTAGELSALTGLTTGAVTGLVDRFEKKNLVKRHFAADDRRKVIIVPHTENIMELLVPLYEDFRSKTEKLIASFSVEESKVIESYFSKAIEIMNEATTVLTSDTDTTNRTSSPKKK